MSDSDFLSWMYNRIINIYGESPNTDFMHRFHKIMVKLKEQEDAAGDNRL